jgi:hypothetical protein
MNTDYSTVSFIGQRALDLLARHQTARVMGATSKGLFLGLSAESIIFLSSEPYRGPLTLNLNMGAGSFSARQPGEAAAVRDGQLRFAPGVWVVDYRNAAAWDAPVDTKIPLPHEQRIAILGTVASRVLSARNSTGLSALLVHLLGLSNQPGPEKDPDLPTRALAWLHQALETGDVEAALRAAKPFFGRGSGLTPSGDDLLLGLLLALNRWGGRLGFHFDMQRFNQGVLEMARRRTTTLSANLLDCAAAGQADERLVAALDGLLTGGLSPDACADHLLAWGCSSGCDAFVGMALAVKVLSSCPLRSDYAH